MTQSKGVNGNTVYVGDGKNAIKVYTYDGTALTYVKTLNVENEVSIEFDKDGNFYTKGGVFAAKKYDAEGTAVGEAAASGEISVSKTSDFALTYFESVRVSHYFLSDPEVAPAYFGDLAFGIIFCIIGGASNVITKIKNNKNYCT